MFQPVRLAAAASPHIADCIRYFIKSVELQLLLEMHCVVNSRRRDSGLSGLVRWRGTHLLG